MAMVVVEWERIERRQAQLIVPDDATAEQITDLADKEAHRGRAGKMDTILADKILSVSWSVPDGSHFGGRLW